MQYIIDRFEGALAVCEADNGVMVDIPREELPAEAREGDVLVMKEGKLCIDPETTMERRKRIHDKMTKLFS